MPEQRRSHSNPDRAEQLPDQQDPDQHQDRASRPPPSPEQDQVVDGRGDGRGYDEESDDTRRHGSARDPRYDDTSDRRETRSTDSRDTRHDDAPSRDQYGDDPGYTGRDWRDDRTGRDTAPPSDTGSARHERDDDRTESPVHAGAGPGSTAGRSSSWGPVLSGAATAFVVFLIFSALWVAIAASGAETVGDNLAWFQLISGVLAAAAGGAAAGWLDPRGTMTGMVQGLSTWGLLVLAMTVTGLTTGTALLGTLGNVTVEANVEAASVTELLQPFENELWALFAVLLGGAVIAALAGALTGRAHTMLALDDQTHRDGAGAARGENHRASGRSASRRG